jgi:type II secretory pathway pseudopilin PulG
MLELIVVIAIMSILASLTFMGFKHAQIQAARNRTSATHRAIISALERYQADFGEYPTATDGVDKMPFGQTNYRIGGAAMLYQALSGDGTTSINAQGAKSTPSDGLVDDTELPNVKLDEMPKEIWIKTNKGYLMIDGFGRPFQYDEGPPRVVQGQPITQNITTINATYDLWSFAEDENGGNFDISSKRNNSISAKWIKNW